MDKVTNTDIVVGAIAGYTWQHIEPWVVSLDRSGFDGVRYMFCYGIDNPETISKLIKYNFIVQQKPALRHPALTVVERFKDISKLCDQMLAGGANPQFNMICPDVRDVVFQKNPSTYLSECDFAGLLVGSEGLKYKDEPWGDQNMRDSFPDIYESMKECTIYNAGTFVGKIGYLRDFAMLVYLLSINNPKVHNPDQAALNILLRYQDNDIDFPHLCGHHDNGWACQAGTTADPTKLPFFRSHLDTKLPFFNKETGLVETSNGEPFVLVHQYDRVPEWNKVIREKYKE